MIRRLARWGLATLLVVAACGFVVAGSIAALVVRGGLVDPARLARPDDAIRVVDRHGRALRQTRVNGIDRRWVALGDVAPILVDAFVATEDASFRSHRGVDVPAVFRAVVTNMVPWRRRSGASTITEQLVKLTYGRRGPIVWVKTLEAARAIALERTLTKDQILEQYLNRVPYPDGVEGVARASEVYFGCAPRALTLAQAALIAGIPQAPTANDPRRHPDRARARRDAVLARMLATGVIDRVAYASAVATPLELTADAAHPYEAPRFVDRVLRQVRDHRLAPADGTLATTLDLDLQRDAERLLLGTLARFESRGAHNAAALVASSATGEVLAYVGAADATDDRGGALDLLAAPRAPGSTLKPFVYELWFERGGTAATVVDDLPSPMTGARGESFEARDYDGHARGPVRARVALSSSLNLAALDVARRAGPDAIVQRLRDVGIHVPGRASDYGGAIVLGGLSVAPWDLAEAYVTLARDGEHIPLSVTPGEHTRPERVMRAAAAALTRDVLADASARRDGFGADLTDLAPGGAFSLKTGTSSGWRDAWAVVFDDRYTVLVWIGDPAGVPMRTVSGFAAAAPAAARILAAARSRGRPDTAPAQVAESGALTESLVCARTGLRAGPRCTHVVRERFVPGTVPAAVCEAHDVHGHDVLAPRYAAWVDRTRPAGVTVGTGGAVTAVEIRSPGDGARLAIDPSRGDTVVPLRATAPARGVVPAQWEVDGRSLPDGRWVASAGQHRIVAVWNGVRSAEANVTVVELTIRVSAYLRPPGAVTH